MMATRNPKRTDTATSESTSSEFPAQDILDDMFRPSENGGLFAVGLRPTLIRQLANFLTSHERPESAEDPVRLLVSPYAWNAATEDIIVEEALHTATDNGTLEARLVEPSDSAGGSLPEFIVAGSRVSVVTMPGSAAKSEHTGVIAVDRPEQAAGHRDTFMALFSSERSDEPSFDVPRLREIEAAASSRLSDAFVEDLQTVFGTVSSLGTADDPLEFPLLLLALGARHQERNKAVSYTADLAGVVSKATMSRRRPELEDAGLVETEKIPPEVGRPELRLLPGEEWVAEAPTLEFVSKLRDRLGEFD